MHSKAEVPVSVIVPNYNSGSFLHQCIGTINCVSAPTEILIVDDASTDNSLGEAWEIAKLHSNIRVLARDANGGIAKARFDGIAAAKCEWVAFVDADDYLEAGAVKAAWEGAIASGSEVCLWDMWRSDHRGEWCGHPLEDVNFPLTGREATLMTLGTWRIHGLGVSRKALFTNAYRNFTAEGCNADELISRLALSYALSVTRCHKRYFYRVNPSSSSLRLRPHRLTELDTHLYLLSFAKDFAAPLPLQQKVVRNAIGNAWYFWCKRKEIGQAHTLLKLEEFLGQLSKTKSVLHAVKFHPKHITAYFFLRAVARIYGAGAKVRPTAPST